MSYQEQLQDIRWKQKRTEILWRDEFRCRGCNHGCLYKLEIHHLVYLSGRMAWEYPNELLMTLCRSCHQLRQSREEAIHIAVAIELSKLTNAQLESEAWSNLEPIYKQCQLAS